MPFGYQYFCIPLFVIFALLTHRKLIRDLRLKKTHKNVHKYWYENVKTNYISLILGLQVCKLGGQVYTVFLYYLKMANKNFHKYYYSNGNIWK